MERRTFLAMPAAAAALPDTPKYHVVSAFQPTARPGMPGPYPGSVVSVKADKSIDPETEKVDATVVAEVVQARRDPDQGPGDGIGGRGVVVHAAGL